MTPRSPGADGARSIIAAHERTVPVDRRREHGVHYTPPEVAAAVIDLAIGALGRLPVTVCDPTCGAGAFLLSVAERLHVEGVDAAEIVTRRLTGVELDPAAAAAARAALAHWASEHGADVTESQIRIQVADALALDPARWPFRPSGGFDLVIGNPPFLGQLSTRTTRAAPSRAAVAQRFGQLGAYTDSAGLFLLAALELCCDDGVASLLQPWSFLAARDAQPVRDRLLGSAELVAMWGSDEQLFDDAAVQVCAPVLRRAPAGAGSVQVRWRSGPERQHTAPRPAVGSSWGPLLAAPMGIPTHETDPRSGRVAEIASATSGFRDEYYALLGAASESDDPLAPPLVTVGMIDPFQLRWGTATHRLGGASVSRPRVDLDELGVDAPRVARWVGLRRRPKVLVATQTRIVEAVVDPGGALVPMTPVISVEPVDAADVWHLAAALSAPPVSATVASQQLGSGRAAGALRWSARGATEARLPLDRAAWDRGADIVRGLSVGDGSARDRDAAFEEFARVMTVAHGLVADDPVVSWWSDRRPRR